LIKKIVVFLKKTSDYINSRIDTYNLFPTLLPFLIGFSILYYYYTKDKFDSESDITQIEGVLSDYSFIQESRGVKRYYIWLEDYECTFQIPADFVYKFNEGMFYAYNLIGKFIELEISTNQLKNLKSDNYIFVLGIKSNNYTFLDRNETLKIEKSKFVLYFGYIFIFIGLFDLYKRIKK
jgi:hypothetical protein